MKSSAHILIVDDVPQNIQIIARILSQDHYGLSFSQSGAEALKLTQNASFDLILLDVQMPEMDGYQVCRQLKQQAVHAQVPILFLTANASAEQVSKGFEVGAVDYISKPVEPLELRARVKNHLALKQAHDFILEQNISLQQLNLEKNELLKMVSHDLRNPLTVMVSGLDFLNRHLDEPDPRIERRLKNMWLATERMESIIDHFLNRESILVGNRVLQLEWLELRTLLTKVKSHFQEDALNKNIDLCLQLEVEICVYTDGSVLAQIIDNLVSNAIKFSPHFKTVWLRAFLDQEHLTIQVEDQGPGFTWSEQEDLFTFIGPRSAVPTFGETSLGLGLTIVKKLTDLLNGQIECVSEPGQGATFILTIPLAVPDVPQTDGPHC